jgi:radical SAM superfamily enzyme YgiQ (UPF0313 family)
MKRIALINPPTPDGNFVPPLGLLTIAAVLEKHGYEPAVFDANADPSAQERIKDFKPDLMGLTAVTSAILPAKRLAGELRGLLPSVPVVFGGPHPAAVPLESISWPEVDFVVAGEGEAAMLALVQWLEAKAGPGEIAKVPNLHHKVQGLPQFTFHQEFLSSMELSELPMPAYHLLDVDMVAQRLRHGLFRKGKRALPYMASRGCPHLCAFCCQMMGRRVRRKSPKQVISEIEYLVSAYNLDEIYIEDDNFTSSKRFAVAVLDGIYERGLPISIKFANGARIDTLDNELLEKMRRAGCSSLSFGLESGSARVLKMMQKHLDLDLVRRRARDIKKHGFLMGANMILGFPGETEEDIWESYDFFSSLGLDSIAVVNLIPFPGTQVRSTCEENGYLTEEASSWDNYYFDIKDPKILIETPFLPKDRLKAVMKKVFLKLYTDRRRLWTLVRHMSWRDVLSGAATMVKRGLAS